MFDLIRIEAIEKRIFFIFRLNAAETKELITRCDRFASLKHSVVMPMAFTEYGVAMLSSVLRSRRAVRLNILIIQIFIRLRRLALTHGELTRKIDDLENKPESHDGQIAEVFAALRRLIEPPLGPKPPIGFLPERDPTLDKPSARRLHG